MRHFAGGARWSMPVTAGLVGLLLALPASTVSARPAGPWSGSAPSEDVNPSASPSPSSTGFEAESDGQAQTNRVTCLGLPVTIVAQGGLTVGTNGDDVISMALPGEVRALGGNDVVCGSYGDDVIDAGGDDDRVFGSEGRDTILGKGGDDRLHGDAARDVLVGGKGYDRVWGNSADDRLYAGPGGGRLRGGMGVDDYWSVDQDTDTTGSVYQQVVNDRGVNVLCVDSTQPNKPVNARVQEGERITGGPPRQFGADDVILVCDRPGMHLSVFGGDTSGSRPYVRSALFTQQGSRKCRADGCLAWRAKVHLSVGERVSRTSADVRTIFSRLPNAGGNAVLRVRIAG